MMNCQKNINANRKTIILFIHHSPNIGGAGISGLTFLNAINKDKFDLFVYTASNGGTISKLFIEKGFKVIEGGLSPATYPHCVGDEKFAFSPRSIMQLFKVLIDKKQIKKIIDIVKPNIIILNSMTLFWISKLAKKRSIKTAILYRETAINGLFGCRRKFIENFISKNTNLVVFISDFDKASARRIKTKKITIYNAFEKSDYINKLDLEKAEDKIGKIQLLYIGGMSKLKGIHTLLKAFSIMDFNKYHLNIVGYNWNGQIKRKSSSKSLLAKFRYFIFKDFEYRMTKFMHKNRLYNEISFHDKTEDISKIYKIANLLIFPVTKPHQSRPLIECAFLKLPIIISDFPNYNEFNENSFYVFKPNNYLDLYRKIEYIFSSNTVNNVIKNNYEFAIRKHGYDVYKEKVNQMILDLDGYYD